MSKTGSEISYDLNDVIEILRRAGNKKLFEIKTVRPTFLDSFLFSGRFNSVLGLDGFQFFKDQLKEVIKKVNAHDFGANYINLDRMYEVLLSSGVYYVEEHLPSELQILKSDVRWLTAYRYIAKNFPDLNYKDFREIVKRFKDTSGHSFFVTESDSKELQSVGAKSALFDESIDAKAAFLQMPLKDLKALAEGIGVHAARSIEETANRIIEKAGTNALSLISEEFKKRRTLFIRDQELATGTDLVNLDEYLRLVAKVVREDLVQFINRQRQTTLAS